MYCAKCGTSIPDTAANCPQCGASTSTAPPSSAPPPSAPLRTPVAAPTPGGQNVAPPQRYSGAQQTDGKAVGSLILGILALFPLGILAGIPAVILGHLSKSSIARSLGRLKGEGMATAGLVMGYLSIAFIPLVLIIAAIAIPNLLRAKMDANERAARSAVRTINTAQMTYITTYPDKGYAVDLASLGPGSEGSCSTPDYPSTAHACILDGVLAGGIKNGYTFNVTAICDRDACSDFVVTAMPVGPTSGMKSFCSTSDGIVRFKGGRGGEGAIVAPQTVEACRSWLPVR